MAPNREPGAEQVVTITALGHRGDGIAESETGRVFIPYSLEGEQARAEVQGNRGRILEILDPSPDRISPFCRHFGACGGCTSQHMNDRAYRRWKRGLVETALRARGLDVPVCDVVDAHGAGRRRVTIHMNIVKGEMFAGFMAARSHRLLDIDVCPVLAPDLENITDICRELAAAVRAGKKPFDIRANATETGLDCDIAIRKDPGAAALIELSDVAAKYDLARICLDGDMLLERRAPVIVCGKARVAVPPGVFLQATEKGAHVLADLVREYARGAEKIADLFCGIGPFALHLAENAQVFAADSDKSSIAALQTAVRHTQGLKPVAANARDLYRNPLLANDLRDFDAVIFDPPRAGAMAQVHEIAASRVGCVIAVSCDPGSFARDAEILVKNGYKLAKIVPVDQFKYTPHIELVARFYRV